MKITELCQMNDLSLDQMHKALASLQNKGLVTGYNPSDLQSNIVITEAAVYVTPQTMLQTSDK